MQIRMRYFASLREIVGVPEEILTIPAGADVANVRLFLMERYPLLEHPLKRAVCAVNRQYVGAEVVLHADDEVVFIPPVGGGELSRSGKVSGRWSR